MYNARTQPQYTRKSNLKTQKQLFIWNNVSIRQKTNVILEKKRRKSIILFTFILSLLLTCLKSAKPFLDGNTFPRKPFSIK